jgi:hypothetical protein
MLKELQHSTRDRTADLWRVDIEGVGCRLMLFHDGLV